MKTWMYFFSLLLVGMGYCSELRGQFTPDRFTNRPLTLMNDATSVGWNPALLGMTGETDAVLVIPYDRTWQSTRLVGGFFSSQGVGLGYTSMRNEHLPEFSFVPWSFYGGLGVKVPGYNVWTGASFRYSEFGGRTLRYSGSVIYNPYDRLYLSAGISNLNSVNTRDIVYQLSTTYTPWDWLSMYGRLQYCSEAPIYFEEKYSSEFGISAAINRRRIIASFSANPVAREARFGLEFIFDVFSFGSLNDASTLNSESRRFNGGNILLRVNHDNFYAYDHYRYPKQICKTQRCKTRGCEGERCGDALCPAYRCVNVDCSGKPCTRRSCKGLVCPYVRKGSGHIQSSMEFDQRSGKAHGNCSHCQHGNTGTGHTGNVDGEHSMNYEDTSHAEVYVGGDHKHNVGCPHCGCVLPGHERVTPINNGSTGIQQNAGPENGKGPGENTQTKQKGEKIKENTIEEPEESIEIEEIDGTDEEEADSTETEEDTFGEEDESEDEPIL